MNPAKGNAFPASIRIKSAMVLSNEKRDQIILILDLPDPLNSTELLMAYVDAPLGGGMDYMKRRLPSVHIACVDTFK